MSKTLRLKVVVVGAGVAGLSLANCLERAGIEYVLLERNKEVVYNVGASVGLMPNGLRILDQLDVYEQLRALADPLTTTYNRTKEGTIFSSSNVSAHAESRLGYPILFFERQHLLKILFEKLKDRSQIHTGKQVVSYQNLVDRVVVTTSDGFSYEGDILIGCDGVHSITRILMTAALREEHPDVDLGPGFFTDYKCVFGVSVMDRMPKAFVPGTVHMAYNKHSAVGEIIGIENHVYWFLYEKFESRQDTTAGLRFSKADKTAMVQKFLHSPTTEEMTFGDLWKCCTKSAMVPLEEGYLKHWYHKRVLVLGDSAHKVSPNGGQGANSCIESAAVITNYLHELQARRLSGTPDTRETFTSIFANFQADQMPRISNVFDVSYFALRLNCLDGAIIKVFVEKVMPVLGDDFQINFSSALVLDSPKIEFIKKPLRIGSVPLETSPCLHLPLKREVGLKWIFACTLAAMLPWLLRKTSTYLLATTVLPEPTNAYFLGLDSLEASSFIANGLPMAAIWLTELMRPQNGGRFFLKSLVLGSAYQQGGIPFSVSAFALASESLSGLNNLSHDKRSDVIPAEYADTMMKTLLTVYPTVALLSVASPALTRVLPVPFGRVLSDQDFWPYLPATLAMCHHLLTISEWSKTLGSGKVKRRAYGNLDKLRMVYAISAVIPGLFYVGYLGYAIIQWRLVQAFRQMWMPRGSWEFLVIFGGALVGGWRALCRVKQPTSFMQKAMIVLKIGLSTLLVGPGTTLAAIWALREEAIFAKI